MKSTKHNEDELSATERIILMLLYSSRGKVRGKLWFQKEMFELSKAFEELREELDFNAYSYGPFSEALDEYRDMLENSGLIENLKLTREGLSIAQRIWEQSSDREKKIVKKIADFLESLDDDELLLYIYVTSPGMAEKSEIREKILRRRVQIALKMLRKGKVSLGLAAKLADLPLNEIRKKAIEAGIKPFDIEGDVEDKN